ncbi:MAG: ABC transporter permease [Candidatus Paracaedibacteraceae bacterium]|nr:ABC transporter permease [Candidatus Paracaedibacteraceae bacterium]
MIDLLLKSLEETVCMVVVSTIIAVLGGLPLAVYLALTSHKGLKANQFAYGIAGFLVNATRSIPYIILMVLMMPVTRLLVGTTIGVWAATVPLAIAGILLLARLVEDALRQTNYGLIEVGLASGATTSQIVKTIMMPEALPMIISSITTVIVNLIGFSAMAGAVGGGGLGDLAIRYGYQRYELELLCYIVAILVMMVQFVQITGNALVKKFMK